MFFFIPFVLCTARRLSRKKIEEMIEDLEVERSYLIEQLRLLELKLDKAEELVIKYCFGKSKKTKRCIEAEQVHKEIMDEIQEIEKRLEVIDEKLSNLRDIIDYR